MNEEYHEIILTTKNKQSAIAFFQKSNDMINSELRNKDTITNNNDGSITRNQVGVVAGRIADRVYAMIQRKTISNFDRDNCELQAKIEILQEIKSKSIDFIEEEVLEYAVEAKVREFIKKNISNEFIISKDEIIEMAQAGSNNLSYVMEKIIPLMKSDNTQRVIERYVDDDFKKRTKYLEIPTMPTFGIDRSDDDDDDEKFIVRVNPDLLVELIGINKTNNSGFSTIYLVAKEKFDSTKTRILYEILARTIGIMNRYDRKIGKAVYTYKELLEIFGSNLAKQKKTNTKYDANTMQSNQEFLTDKNGNQIYLTDKYGNIVYKKDYKKTYNDFKKTVLNVSISEYNNKTDYEIELVEIKRTKLGKISKRGEIESIEFFITDNRPIKTNNFISTMYFFKENKENLTLSQIKGMVKNNKQITDNKPITRDYVLNTLKVTEDLVELDLIENNKAYSEIKEIFSSKNPALSALYFDEEYGVIFDKMKQKDSNGLHYRLGDNCFESIEIIKLEFKEIIDDILEKKDNKELSFFLPFTAVIDNKAVKINLSNFNIYITEVESIIKNGSIRNFKGFKSKFIKQEFIDYYFSKC